MDCQTRLHTRHLFRAWSITCLISASAVANTVHAEPSYERITRDLHVCRFGCRFHTIRAAVDSAHSGSTIYIGPGTYYENVVIPEGKDLNLVGSSASQTMIDGRFKGPVFAIGPLPWGEGSNEVNLSRLTITHGSNAMGGGIAVAGTLLTVSDSAIVFNRADESGGGLELMTEVTGSSSTLAVSVTLKDCLIANNRAPSGGGLHSQPEVNTVISDSAIVRNHSETGGGAFIEYASRVRMDNVIIGDNRADGDGGGLWVAAGGIGEPATIVTLNHTSVTNNTATRGGGIFSSCLLGHCIVLQGENAIALNSPSP